MRKSKRIIAGMVLMMALCGCSSQNTDPMKTYMENIYGENEIIESNYDKNLSVRCSNGTFVGIDEDDVLSFKGIPYAQAPVGDLRWKEPVPVEDSNNVYEAYYYGKSPVQSEWPSEVGSYYKIGEDCLNLNVWMNVSNKAENKTVMVFFHGGSYGWGATSDPMYDGHNMIKKFDDVILVTVEYRVGMMGFIDFSQVEGGEEYATSGNLGLLDQICALQWIQKNIAAFGGNPENVTIFGESAGGGSVSLLPLIDGTDGLFKRIIAESGSVALTFGKEECQEQTRLLLETSGCSNMEELKALSLDELMAISDEISDSNIFPERDGIVLPEDLYEEYASGKGKNIDMMIGSNADECRYWIKEMGYYSNLVDGDLIYKIGMPMMLDNNLLLMSKEDQNIVKSFISDLDDKRIWNITEFYNEMLFRLPAIKMAELHTQYNNNTYMYYWEYPSAYNNIGACHAVELAYVFGNLEDTAYTGDNINVGLSDTVMNMWVNFARTGNPSTEDITWEPYKVNNRMTMIFDAGNVHMEGDVKAEQREKLEPILKYKLNGCYSQMSLNVPTVYKLVAMLVGAVIVTAGIIALVVKRTKNKKVISEKC